MGQTVPEEPHPGLSHGVNSGKRYWSDGTPVAGQQFEYGFDETCPVRE
jgi:hypothetical protein